MATIETFKGRYLGYYLLLDHDFGVKTYVFKVKESNKANSEYMRPIFYIKTSIIKDDCIMGAFKTYKCWYPG